MKRLEGKTAIITGAAQGMGANHARRFVEEGANVVITDIQAEKGGQLAKQLGERAVFASHDVTSGADWDRAVEIAEQRFGGVDILVNNAAFYFITAVDQAEPEKVRQLLDINIFGTWLGISKVVPAMRGRGGGAIVNLSSLAGSRGIPFHSIYGASKWAIRGLTKSAAYDLGPDNIRVNAVLPGAIEDTGMFTGTDEEQLAAIPLRRVGTPDEVSNLVVFLASAESDYITGADHLIDGGRGLW